MLHCAWSRNRRACAECIIESPACLLPACQPGKHPISQISPFPPPPPQISRTCALTHFQCGKNWRQNDCFSGFQNFKFKLLFLFVCLFFFSRAWQILRVTTNTEYRGRPTHHPLPAYDWTRSRLAHHQFPAYDWTLIYIFSLCVSFWVI
jgi:hypothetical protein